MLITFSGLDGSGKTTLIGELKAILEGRNRRVRVMTMYDDIAFFALLRLLRDAAKRLLRAASGSPRPPPDRLDIDERGNVVRASSREAAFVYRVTRKVWLRQLAYLGDLVICRLRLFYERRIRGNAVILDRYFYDSMVDIAAAREGVWYYTPEEAERIGPLRWLYIRLILLAAPEPDAAILVDVDPEVTYARKPEYPLEYLRSRQVAYRAVLGLARRRVVIENYDRAASRARLLAVADRVVGNGGLGDAR